MAIHPDFDPTNLYFITTTAVTRVHLFRRDVIKRIIVDSLRYMRLNQWLNLHAFVVMPNHVHFIVRFLEGYTLSDVMREFKKHTSKQIIRQYRAEDNQRVIAFLEQAAEHLADQRYKVWEKGYDDIGILDLAIAVAEANQWARFHRFLDLDPGVFY